VKQQIGLAISYATKQYNDAFHWHHRQLSFSTATVFVSSQADRRLPNGTLQQISPAAATSKYTKLANNVVVKEDAITRRRHKQGSLNP
jgi:hypothetical protein